MRVLVGIVLCVGVLTGGFAFSQEAPSDSLDVHDPYDLSSIAPVDSNDVYRSPRPSVFSFPKYIWSALVYPLGKFAIYAEHAELVAQYYTFFTNQDGTIGLFPHVVLGGETGTGGGAKFFHTNLFGKQKILTGSYAYAGSRGQIGEWLYVDPSLGDSRVMLKIDGLFLRTHNRSASINGAVEEDDLYPNRLFRMDQVDSRASLTWSNRQGRLTPFLPSLGVEVWGAYGRRDFRTFLGGTEPLTDPGSSPLARQLIGINEQYDLGKFGGRLFYDDRDFKRPTESLILPLNYRLPGRVVSEHDGLYYFWRDLGYPERGGLIQAEAEWVTGSEHFQYYRVGAEVQRFFTLFWRDRILAVRGRLQKVRAIDDHRVPYSELITMGGGKQTRGYRRGHFRGQGALLFNVEYRWPIWDTWNAYLFWDESQSFDHFDDVTGDGFATSVGGGIAFRTEIGLIGKLQVGHSAENDALVGFTVGGDF